MRWLSRWLLMAIATIVLAGCESEGRKQNTAEVRFLHASVDTEAFDILVDDDVQQAGLVLGTTSGYASFDSGTHTTKIRSAATGTVLLESSISYSSSEGNTLIVYGKRNALRAVLVNGDTPSPDSNRFKVRVMGLAPDAGTVDVYLTSSADISSIPATLSNVGYGSTTDWLQVSGGDMRIAFAAAGTKEILFEAASRSFANGTKYTLAVFPSSGGRLVNAVLLTEGNDGTGTYLLNSRSRMRAVNADATSTSFNFAVGGAVLFSSVPYRGTSSYALTNAGDATVVLESASVPGSAAATIAHRFEPARDYTMLASAVDGAQRLDALADDNALPGAGLARVRFINAFGGSSSVDALVNFASLATGIAPRAASAYYEVAPSDSFTFTFTTPGGVSAIAALSPAKLDSGIVYSVIGTGSAGSTAELRLVRDR